MTNTLKLKFSVGSQSEDRVRVIKWLVDNCGKGSVIYKATKPDWKVITYNRKTYYSDYRYKIHIKDDSLFIMFKLLFSDNLG